MENLIFYETERKSKRVQTFKRLLMMMAAMMMAFATFTACEKLDNNDDNNGDEKLNEDGLTQDVLKILPGDYLKKLKETGIEINGGNKPADIEGTYLAKPNICVKSSLPGDSWVGLEMIDAEITFSEQNNAKLTVLTNFVEYIDGGAGQTGKGTGSFITGSGNKFTVFVKMTGTLSGLPLETIDVYSGEISPSGIKNYQSAQITVKGNMYSTLPEGEVRLFKDSDGLAERIK